MEAKRKKNRDDVAGLYDVYKTNILSQSICVRTLNS